MVSRKADGAADVMSAARRLVIGYILLVACSGAVDAQADTANARVIDGAAAAVATAGELESSMGADD